MSLSSEYLRYYSYQKDFPMKKNILVVQRLLVLPLIISSPLLAMERKETPQTQQSVSHDQLFEELQNLERFKQQKQLHNSSSDISNENNPTITAPTNTAEPSPLMQSEIEIITLTLPNRMSAKQNLTKDQPNPLLQSVMLPTQEKELGFLEKLAYHTSTAHQHRQKMISYLQNDQFDVTNLTHFKWLEEAIATATAHDDIDSLATIAMICHKKYPDTIRIMSEDIAQRAFEKLEGHYTEKLSKAELVLQLKHQDKMKQWNITVAACRKSIHAAIEMYNQNVKELYDNYDQSVAEETNHVNNVSEQIKALSSLNRNIRPSTTVLLTNNPLQTPKDIFATTMKEAEKRLIFAQKEINEMPTIMETKPRPQQLALTNK